MLAKSSPVVAGRFGEDEIDEDFIAVKDKTRKQERTVIEFSPNKRTNGAKGVKQDDNNGDALIEYVRSMSNVINKPVDNKISKRAEALIFRAIMSELKKSSLLNCRVEGTGQDGYVCTPQRLRTQF